MPIMSLNTIVVRIMVAKWSLKKKKMMNKPIQRRLPEGMRASSTPQAKPAAISPGRLFAFKAAMSFAMTATIFVLIVLLAAKVNERFCLVPPLLLDEIDKHVGFAGQAILSYSPRITQRFACGNSW